MTSTLEVSKTKKGPARLNVKDFVKASREKKNLLVQQGKISGDPFAILVDESSSTPPSYEATSLGTTSTPRELENYFCLKCSSDNRSFFLPFSVAQRLGCVRTLLTMKHHPPSTDDNNAGVIKEKEENQLIIHQFDSEIVEKVLRFCIEDAIFNPPSSSSSASEEHIASNGHLVNHETFLDSLGGGYYRGPAAALSSKRVVFLVSLPPEVVMDVMMAAHFLQVPRLVDIACKMLADHFVHIPTLEGLPDDVILRILNYLRPECLTIAEKQPFVQDFLQANKSQSNGAPKSLTDFQQLWRNHFQSRQWNLEVSRHLGNADSVFVVDQLSQLHLSLRSILPELHKEDEELISSEDPSQNDWRRLFLETDFEYKFRLYPVFIHKEKSGLVDEDGTAEEEEEEGGHNKEPIDEEEKDEEELTLRRAKRFLDSISRVSESIQKMRLPIIDDLIEREAEQKKKSKKGQGQTVKIPDSLDILSRLTHLRKLDVSGHVLLSSCREKMERFCTCLVDSLSSLHSLRFSGASMPLTSLEILLRRLLSPRSSQFRLRSLDLSENKFGRDGVTLISKALQENDTLLALYLADNSIHEEPKHKQMSQGREKASGTSGGCLDLFEVLGTNSKLVLRVLDLSRNNIDFEELLCNSQIWQTRKVSSLAQNRSLTHFFASDCLSGSKEQNLLALAHHLPSSLLHLDISSNYANFRAVENFFQVLKERLTTGTGPRLQSLDISQASTQGDGFQRFLEWLEMTRSLTRVSLRGCNLTDIDEGNSLATFLSQLRQQPQQRGEAKEEGAEEVGRSEGKNTNSVQLAIPPITHLILDSNPLGRSAFPIAQAWLEQLPEDVSSSSSSLTNVLSLIRNPLLTHHLPPAPIQRTAGELPPELPPLQNPRLHSGKRIAALLETEEAKKRNVVILTNE